MGAGEGRVSVTAMRDAPAVPPPAGRRGAAQGGGPAARVFPSPFSLSDLQCRKPIFFFFLPIFRSQELIARAKALSIFSGLAWDRGHLRADYIRTSFPLLSVKAMSDGAGRHHRLSVDPAPTPPPPPPLFPSATSSSIPAR